MHESFNLAALWRLPLLLVCENNGWGEFLPTTRHLAFDLAGLAAAYGIPHREVDGNDVVEVAVAARETVAAIRAGSGPAILECATTRVRGHYEGDAQKYRDPEELASLAARDPLRRAEAALRARGVTDEALTTVAEEVAGTVAAALETARAGAEPDFAAARADVTSAAAHG